VTVYYIYCSEKYGESVRAKLTVNIWVKAADATVHSGHKPVNDVGWGYNPSPTG